MKTIKYSKDSITIPSNKIDWNGKSRYRVKSSLLQPKNHRGIESQQNPNAYSVFNQFFQDESFDFVIEIGTSYGGLSLYLYEQSLQHEFNFITYDYLGFRNGIWSTRQNELKVAWNNELLFDFRDKDVFLDDTITEISTILQNNKCLLLCDGGDKPKEIQIYSEYLQSGSYIMGHDYSPDEDYFNANTKHKVWNWLELRDEDISKAMKQHNLSKCDKYYTDFRDTAWVCLIKE
tara:strand:+ start:3003 stop:3701 length:699 start_codon:yes stop_codon:yes gene_type:complete